MHFGLRPQLDGSLLKSYLRLVHRQASSYGSQTLVPSWAHCEPHERPSSAATSGSLQHWQLWLCWCSRNHGAGDACRHTPAASTRVYISSRRRPEARAAEARRLLARSSYARGCSAAACKPPWWCTVGICSKTYPSLSLCCPTAMC